MRERGGGQKEGTLSLKPSTLGPLVMVALVRVPLQSMTGVCGASVIDLEERTSNATWTEAETDAIEYSRMSQWPGCLTVSY